MHLENLNQSEPTSSTELLHNLQWGELGSGGVVKQFVARQPILDGKGKTFGYELLYRSGAENRAIMSDAHVASATVIDAALTMGLDLLCGGAKAFINCTEELLLSREVEVLPPEAVVLELLETVPATDEVQQACWELKGKGYKLALDDYFSRRDRATLLGIADIVKLEIRHITPENIDEVRKLSGRGIRLLGEQVETWAQVRTASRAGCDLFQGYFFAHPQMLEVQKLRPLGATYLRVMQILSSERFCSEELVEALKREPSLCFGLLRYLNSYQFGLDGEIRSLSQAVSLLGEANLRRWLTISTIACSGGHGSNELLRMSLMRARFCELLAPYVGQREEEMFLTGLLSLFHAVLNISTENLVSQLAVSAEVKRGLLDANSEIGMCCRLAGAYGRGDWSSCWGLADSIGVDTSILPALYTTSLHWAQQLSVS